jgi:hypothetical protein
MRQDGNEAAIEEVCKMVAPQLLEARASNLPLSFLFDPSERGEGRCCTAVETPADGVSRAGCAKRRPNLYLSESVPLARLMFGKQGKVLGNDYSDSLLTISQQEDPRNI